MANNFVNSFASIVTAGEFYQSNASDASTGPQTVYTANNGSSGVNSILVELDAANTSSAGITVSAIVIYKAYHIVKDAPVPSGSTLKIVAGQKIVLNSNDKVIAYASAATCDLIAGILQEVT